MTRLRMTALIATATIGGFLALTQPASAAAPDASTAAATVNGTSAALTPTGYLSSDLNYVRAAEVYYAKVHHVAGKAFALTAGRSTNVGTYKITARGKETISTKLGAEGSRHGFCAVIRYTPVHSSGHFAYYDSVLDARALNATGFKVGGACYPTAAWQANLKAAMKDDIKRAAAAEEKYIAAGGQPYGISFHAVPGHPAKVGDSSVTAAPGDVLDGFGNDYARGYCITVANTSVTGLAQHAYSYSSTTGVVKAGGFGYDRSGPCAAPPPSY